ncbi:hypothetical protein BS78_02G211400 [Paspalum vaginatum]|nr:hypothetical protein BS78_02G211400 [Paspalum vaginatum]
MPLVAVVQCIYSKSRILSQICLLSWHATRETTNFSKKEVTEPSFWCFVATLQVTE